MIIDLPVPSLADWEEKQYRSLFECIVHCGQDVSIRGNVVIPFGGNGKIGSVKTEQYVNLAEPRKGS